MLALKDFGHSQARFEIVAFRSLLEILDSPTTKFSPQNPDIEETFKVSQEIGAVIS